MTWEPIAWNAELIAFVIVLLLLAYRGRVAAWERRVRRMAKIIGRKMRGRIRNSEFGIRNSRRGRTA